MTDTATLDVGKIVALRADGFEMIAGHGENGAQGCAMDVIAWAATGEWTDMPDCVHPILSKFVQHLNDRNGDVEFRWQLVIEAGPWLIGTSDWPALRAVWVISAAGSTVAGLTEALIAGANLVGVDLTGAHLANAYLANAYLAHANLTRANLVDADLTGAHLTRANLTGADLVNANLTGANLTGANLTGANLTRANLARANLTGAHLAGANLTGARGDRYTGLPDGWTVSESGRIERSGS